MAASDRAVSRLESWKAVAAYFGRDERTVRRWEAERGLPIRRLPGGVRSRVYAEVEELEAWRRSGAAEAGDAPAGTPPRPLFRRWAALTAGATVMLVALVALGMSWRGQSAAPAGLPPPPLAAQKLYLEGTEAWGERTPASLDKALDDFNAAIALDPKYAEAYVGLAQTFDLLREYTLMPDAQAYPLARDAARRALSLNPNLSDAHAALAFADYWGFWDETAARAEFERAIALDPRSVIAHHWYATFLGAVGDFDGSLREIGVARSLDPTSRSIRADGAELLGHVGHTAEAITALEAAERADPTFSSPHVYLANLYLDLGQDQAFLRESAALAALTGDPARRAELAAARRGYQDGGRIGMLRALLAARAERARAGDASSYSVATLYALLGDSARAIAWLRHSLDRRETVLAALRGDLAFRAMRGDPRFEAVVAQVKPA
ncbi:MAG: TPR end-of-group domain-containing protein [Caulobacteraceae bacterium]